MDSHHRDRLALRVNRTLIDAEFEEQTQTIRFSDDECSENDDEDEHSPRYRPRLDDGDHGEVLLYFPSHPPHYGLDFKAGEVEMESGTDESRPNFSVCTIHSGLTDDEYEDERECSSVSQPDRVLLKPKVELTINNYYGVNGLQVGDNNTYRQQVSRVSVLTCISLYVNKIAKLAVLYDKRKKDSIKLEALGQCIPPSRHVLPVSRYRFGFGSVSGSERVIRSSGSLPKFNHLFIRMRDPDRLQNSTICLWAHCQHCVKMSCKSIQTFLYKSC